MRSAAPVRSPASVPASVVIMRFWPKPNSTSLTMELEMVEVSLAMMLLEGWLQEESTVGKVGLSPEGDRRYAQDWSMNRWSSGRWRGWTGDVVVAADVPLTPVQVISTSWE